MRARTPERTLYSEHSLFLPLAWLSKLVMGVTLLFAFAVSSIATEVPEKKLQQLADDIQHTLKTEKPEQKEPRPASSRESLSVLLTTLRTALARRDLGQMQTVLEQFVATLDSAALRDRCAEAAAEIRVLSEAKDKETLAEIDSVVKRATVAVREAKKSGDLDAMLLELDKFRIMRQEHTSPGPVNFALAEMEHVIRFVTYWQDYIAQSQGGDTKAAHETLRLMAQIPPNTLIPRSELLARTYSGINLKPSPSPIPKPSPPAIPSATPFEKVMVQLVLKTPDDLIPAIEKMTALFNSPNQVRSEERPELQRFIGAMTALSNVYAEFKAGLATKLEIAAADPTRADRFGPILAPIRAQVLKLLLPRYLCLPPGLTPSSEEGVQEFLSRVVDQAVKKGDFLLAAQARETQTMLREGKVPEPNRLSQAALYVTAHNQEVAGQYDLAVASYQRALATGTDLVPPKVIGERLARIKAAHPKEFAAGLEIYLNYIPGGPPGSHRRQGPAQNPVLQVPASSPTPTTPAPAPSPAPSSTP